MGEMKVQKHKCCYPFVVLMIIPSIVNSLRCNIRNCQKTQIDFASAKDNEVLTADQYFPVENGNKRKLAALNKENCEEHPRNNMVQNSNVPRSQEVYNITQVSEEIEGRVTKKVVARV